MTRPTNPNGRSRNVDENLNKVDLSASNNKPSSPSKSETTPPILRSIPENNEVKLYPFIQQGEYKYKDLLTSHENSSSSTFELTSRLSSAQKKNGVTAFEAYPIQSFEQMPEDVIRKILFEHFIDLNDIPTTAKNLMHFASISKFNREYVRVLLTEEGMREVSFEITKSAIPNLLAKFANDKQAEFTQVDIDELVHNWPYLTFDCSLQENTTYTNRGLDALQKIVSHPGLKAIRIINNLPANYLKHDENFLAFNNNGSKLIYSLLSRKSSDRLEIDFKFNNWMSPPQPKFQLKDQSFDLIKKIQTSADKCGSVLFGEMDLSRGYFVNTNHHKSSEHQRDYDFEYRFEFIKTMCNIAVSHSAHTISLVGLHISDNQLDVILNQIQQYDGNSLQHLDLSGNDVNEATVKNLSAWLQSEKIKLKTLILINTSTNSDELDILYEALKNNLTLESVVIGGAFMPRNHQISTDKRVKFTDAILHWI